MRNYLKRRFMPLKGKSAKIAHKVFVTLIHLLYILVFEILSINRVINVIKGAGK